MKDDYIKIFPNRYVGEETTIDDNKAKQLQLFSDEVEGWNRQGGNNPWSGNIDKAIWMLLDREAFRVADAALEHNYAIELRVDHDEEFEEWETKVSEFELMAMYSFLVFADFDVGKARDVLLEKFEKVAALYSSDDFDYPFDTRLTWHEHYTFKAAHMGIEHDPEHVAELEF